jgi:hypothetical protein
MPWSGRVFAPGISGMRIRRCRRWRPCFCRGAFRMGIIYGRGLLPDLAGLCLLLKTFGEGGGFVMGICNGFQILVEAGWLPGALLRNESGRFICAINDDRAAAGIGASTRVHT